MPKSIAPGTRCTISTPITMMVPTDSSTADDVTSPRATMYRSPTTMSTMRKPIKAWKIPMATVVVLQIIGHYFRAASTRL